MNLTKTCFVNNNKTDGVSDVQEKCPDDYCRTHISYVPSQDCYVL
jgi:hypothetical protein